MNIENNEFYYISKKIRKVALVLSMVGSLGFTSTEAVSLAKDIKVESKEVNPTIRMGKNQKSTSKKVSKWKSFNDKLEYHVLEDGSYEFRKHKYDKKYNKKTKKDTYKCSECGHSYKEKHSHDFTKWKFNDEKGRFERECSDCEINETKKHKKSKTIKVYSKNWKYIKTLRPEKEQSYEDYSLDDDDDDYDDYDDDYDNIVYLPYGFFTYGYGYPDYDNLYNEYGDLESNRTDRSNRTDDFISRNDSSVNENENNNENQNNNNNNNNNDNNNEPEPHVHTYGAWEQHNNNTHRRYCTADDNAYEEADHNMSAWTNSGNNTVVSSCNDCGYELSHTHQLQLGDYTPFDDNHNDDDKCQIAHYT